MANEKQVRTWKDLLTEVRNLIEDYDLADKEVDGYGTLHVSEKEIGKRKRTVDYDIGHGLLEKVESSITEL